MALLWLVIVVLLQVFGVAKSSRTWWPRPGVTTNLWLMAFNLLPIPSMDGGRILFSVLPHKAGLPVRASRALRLPDPAGADPTFKVVLLAGAGQRDRRWRVGCCS
jgi:Zn-dependent protease